MNSPAGSVVSRLLHNAKLWGIACIGLGLVTLVATGFIRVPLLASGANPVVGNLPPVSDSAIAPLVALDNATEAVAHRILPAVVQITVSGQTHPTPMDNQGQGQGEDQIPAPFRQFFGPFQFPRQPRSQVFQAEGSGVIISPDGYIVTNNHVVNGATTVDVTLYDQRRFDNAKVVGTDKATDLAVIKIDATGLPSAAFGDSSQIKPGQTVLAIGDPMGMNFSVTRGIVSAVDRARTPSDGSNSRGTFIQTDAPINHGNSGGPLVDSHGDVVGINTEILSESGASDGIGFAIPSNLVQPTAASLIKNGKVLRGYLGIDVTDLDPDTASSLNEPGAKGALVDQVNADSPAEHAGIKPYDVITGIDGQHVATGSDLQTIAGGIAPGAIAHVNLMRDGKPMSLAVTLGNYDDANNSPAAAAPADDSGAGAGSPIARLGITPSTLTPDVRGQLQLPASVNGVVVAAVTPGGPAMMAGVAQGDVIEQVNQHPVTTVDELQHQLSLTPAGKSVLLLDHRANGNFIIAVH